MKRSTRWTVAGVAAMVLVVAACDGDSDETTVETEAADRVAGEVSEDSAGEEEVADTEATATADTDDVAATAEDTSPAAVVERELAAQMEGDYEAVAALWADDAVAVQPGGTEIGFYEEVPFPIDDFDGDGIVTIMDDHLATAAITPAMGKTIVVDCAEVSETVVDCTETTSNVFSEAAGVEPLVIELQLTVEDGRIVRQEFVGPVGDPTAFETATMSGFDDYGLWVAEIAPDDHAAMFDLSGMTMTMEAVELHNEMLPTYVEETLG